jgi:hypothetical protein
VAVARSVAAAAAAAMAVAAVVSVVPHVPPLMAPPSDGSYPVDDIDFRVLGWRVRAGVFESCAPLSGQLSHHLPSSQI